MYCVGGCFGVITLGFHTQDSEFHELTKVLKGYHPGQGWQGGLQICKGHQGLSRGLGKKLEDWIQNGERPHNAGGRLRFQRVFRRRRHDPIHNATLYLAQQLLTIVLKKILIDSRLGLGCLLDKVLHICSKL